MTNQELFDNLESRGENDRFFIPLDEEQPRTDGYCCDKCRREERE